MESNNSLIVHDYKSHCIYQRKEDGYVDLTQMCRVYKKRYPDWKRLKITNNYIEEVSITVGIPTDELVITTLKGLLKDRGSWGHRLVAMNLAKWLDPAFEVWCNQHLLELVETGTTSLITVPSSNELGITFEDYIDYLAKNRDILSQDKELAKLTLERILKVL